MHLTIHQLTPDLFPALEDLFGNKEPVSRCWCMYWRIGSEFHKKPDEQNKAAFQEIVRRGSWPGLLAFNGEVPVGWCLLTPRNELPWLNRAWQLNIVGNLNVWSVSCIYIRKGYRKRGITSALIEAAIDLAKRGGVPALEAYPLDANLTSSTSLTGYVSTFEHLGF